MSALVGATPDNANPVIHSTAATSGRRSRKRSNSLDLSDDDDGEVAWGGRVNPTGEGIDEVMADEEEEPIDAEEIFDLIRSISDPEHPLSLEQLAVVSPSYITVTHGARLSLRVRLLRALPERYKVDIKVCKGTHQSENSVNKQLNDKERVAAALENQHLLSVVQQCLSTSDVNILPPLP